MLKEARIILPKAKFCEENLARVKDELTRRLTAAFGGYTLVFEGQGGWTAPDGSAVHEGILIFDIAMEHHYVQTRELLDIAEWLKVAADQEAIYVRTTTGKVFFV